MIDNSNFDSDIKKSFFWKKFNATLTVKFNDSKKTLSPCQETTYNELSERLRVLEHDIILKIFEFYSAAYKDYISGIESDGYDPLSETVQEIIPKPSTADLLLNNYTPLSIYIPNSENCEPGFLGIYFDCSWDINNSLGVVIKNWAVDMVGNGDRAFLF